MFADQNVSGSSQSIVVLNAQRLSGSGEWCFSTKSATLELSKADPRVKTSVDEAQIRLDAMGSINLELLRDIDGRKALLEYYEFDAHDALQRVRRYIIDESNAVIDQEILVFGEAPQKIGKLSTNIATLGFDELRFVRIIRKDEPYSTGECGKIP